MEEKWVDVIGFTGFYEVSDLGNIRSLDRIEYCPSKGYRRRNGRMLKPILRNNYRCIMLCKNGIKKWYKMSRIVYSSFNGEIPNGYEINHINETTTDDRLCNLNAMTHRDNCLWGTRLNRIGKTHKKPVTQILPDGTEFFSYFSATDAANGNSALRKHITDCCIGRRKTAGGYYWRYSS